MRAPVCVTGGSWRQFERPTYGHFLLRCLVEVRAKIRWLASLSQRDRQPTPMQLSSDGDFVERFQRRARACSDRRPWPRSPSQLADIRPSASFVCLRHWVEHPSLDIAPQAQSPAAQEASTVVTFKSHSRWRNEGYSYFFSRQSQLKSLAGDLTLGSLDLKMGRTRAEIRRNTPPRITRRSFSDWTSVTAMPVS